MKRSNSRTRTYWQLPPVNFTYLQLRNRSAQNRYITITDPNGYLTQVDRRFGESNQSLFQAVDSLVPSSHSFLVEKSLQPLSQLLGIDQNTLAGELPIAAQLCRNKLQQDSTLEEATLTMRQYQEAFPSVYQLYAGALTIGVSTTTCENSFSALTRVLGSYRRSMGHERKVQLVLLAFEKALTMNVNLNAFVEKFALKSRRIVL